MTRFGRSLLALWPLLGFAFSQPVFATNGIYLIGYGAKARGLGGASIAFPQDSIAGAMNPATITAVPSRADIGIELFRPIRWATIPAPAGLNTIGPGDPINYESGANLFAIPNMGASIQFTDRLYLGLSAVGAGGGSTRYTRLSPLGENFLNPEARQGVGKTLGISLIQGFINATAAYKITEHHSLGASMVIGGQQFRAYGLGLVQPFSSQSDALTNNGNDWAAGIGARVGWFGQLHPMLDAGAYYATKVIFNNFNKYKGLLAEHGSLDAPASYGLGLALKPTRRLTFAFDVTRTLYSDVPSIGQGIEALSSAPGVRDSNGDLGLPGGAGFGWKDQTIYKFGVNYQWDDQWTLRAGYNYGRVPFPKTELLFNSVAPAVVEHHLTLGFTYAPDQHQEVTVTYMHAFENQVSGVAYSNGLFDNFFPNSAVDGPGNMALNMWQDAIDFSYGYKF